MSKIITIPVILGATATGKTACAIALAKQFNASIISCDSRQIYRNMNIGTAKPNPDELIEVNHHLIDICDPNEVYSSFQFTKDALRIIRNAIAKDKKIIICGGTGLYFQTLSNGPCLQLPVNMDYRRELENRAKIESTSKLHEELAEVDPISAKKIHKNDLQRLVRALQVFHDTQRPISYYHTLTSLPDGIDFLPIILSMDRKLLYERINCRVDRMINMGLEQEYYSLRESGYSNTDSGMCAVGYRELYNLEMGVQTREEVFEEIKKNSRRYAKRQLTWFRNKVDGFNVLAYDKNLNEIVYEHCNKRINPK